MIVAYESGWSSPDRAEPWPNARRPHSLHASGCPRVGRHRDSNGPVLPGSRDLGPASVADSGGRVTEDPERFPSPRRVGGDHDMDVRRSRRRNRQSCTRAAAARLQLAGRCRHGRYRSSPPPSMVLASCRSTATEGPVASAGVCRRPWISRSPRGPPGCDRACRRRSQPGRARTRPKSADIAGGLDLRSTVPRPSPCAACSTGMRGMSRRMCR